MDVSKFDEETMAGELVSSDGGIAFRPDPLPPEIEVAGGVQEELLNATRNLGRLSGIGTRVVNPRILLVPFIYKEAVLSSEIEGTRVTLSDIYEYEAGRTEQSIQRKYDLVEVQNYVLAAFQGHEHLDGGIDLDLIRSLHQTLLSGARGAGKHPGSFRETPAVIAEDDGSIRFVPPPASVVPYQMEALESYLRAGGRYDDLIDIGLTHYQFEAIHPFADGNGRMGRLLIVLQICERDILPQPYLYPSSYFNRHRGEYTDRLLAVSQEGAWEEWLEFFLRALSHQATEAFARATELLDLRDEYRETYRDAANSISGLVEELFLQPYLTVNDAANRLDMSYGAANGAIQSLIEDEVLEEITGHRRNRVFRARELFHILQKPPEQLDLR